MAAGSSADPIPPSGEKRRKFYVDGGQVEIAAHLVYELDPQGNQLRVVKYTDYTADKVRSLFPNAAELRKRWADAGGRNEIIAALAERGIEFDELAEAAKQPDADPFDLLCHLAFNAPLRTRRERAERLRTERKDFFDKYGPEAKHILEELLEKYAEHGTTQFAIPEILKVPPHLGARHGPGHRGQVRRRGSAAGGRGRIADPAVCGGVSRDARGTKENNQCLAEVNPFISSLPGPKMMPLNSAFSGWSSVAENSRAMGSSSWLRSKSWKTFGGANLARCFLPFTSTDSAACRT